MVSWGTGMWQGKDRPFTTIHLSLSSPCQLTVVSQVLPKANPCLQGVNRSLQ